MEQQPAEPPSSPEAIWAAAWQGFAPLPGAQQPGAGTDAAAELEAGQITSGQQDDGEEGAAAQPAGLRRSPVLLLEVGSCASHLAVQTCYAGACTVLRMP